MSALETAGVLAVRNNREGDEQDKGHKVIPHGPAARLVWAE
jgi:hypothetical protein